MLRALAQSAGILVGGVAVFVGVVAILTFSIGLKLPQAAAVFTIGLVALAGVRALGTGRAWGALLIALWAALAVALLTTSFLGIIGIELRPELVVLGLVELGVVIVMALAPRANTARSEPPP